MSMLFMKEFQGARLNLEKSTILQLDEKPQPEWFFECGCKIALSREILVYLGCLVGVKLPASQEVNFLLDKVRNILTTGATACCLCKGGLFF